MIFTETKLVGAYVIELEKNEDERGFFARFFCQNEFRALGLKTEIAQCNLSYNKKSGAIRGMHYQVKPHEEAKLVSCTQGALYDVIIDLRRESISCHDWVGVTLSLKNNSMLYVPEGFAHGFQTLADDTIVSYLMFEYHHPECARGIRWDDPSFQIRWPLEVSAISDRDLSYLDFAL